MLEFIRRQAQQHCVRLLCRVLSVAPSSYYGWAGRALSRRKLEDQALLKRVRAAHQLGRGGYGSPRVHAQLRAEGVRCGRKRVERLMRESGLSAKKRRRYVCSTESGGTYSPAPNLLARRFAPGAVKAWVADATCIRTGEGFLHLAVVIDLPTRQVLGYGIAQRAQDGIELTALRMALQKRDPAPGTLHHSDRGSQYVSAAYQGLLSRHGLSASMSRTADCYDNAVAESFFAGLKRETIHPQNIATRAQATRIVSEWIERFYNPVRRHSSLGNLSPALYAKLVPVP